MLTNGHVSVELGDYTLPNTHPNIIGVIKSTG